MTMLRRFSSRLREQDWVAVIIELTIVVAGVFLLLRANWARWLAIGWIAFHTVVGALHGWTQFATHLAIAAVVTYALTRPAANRWLSRV